MKFEMRRPKRSNNEIEVDKFEIVGERETKTRGMIALTVVSICSGFLVGSAIYGMIQGNFTALETVMTYVQTPVGILIGYYFGKKHE